MRSRPEVRRLGRMPYAEALAMQRELVEERRAGRIGDLLLLVEHPHVLTLGVRGDGGRSHILAPAERLTALDVAVHEAGRGGDITYHGPGQVVGYPIIDLKPDRCDVHRYVRDIEEVMIRVTRDYGIEAIRIPGLTGIWVGAEKLGAIGVRIARWVTSHGFAYNANTDLSYFNLIVPCGISDHGVTSLKKLLGREVDLNEVQDRLAHHFGEVFDRKMREVSSESKSIQTYIYRRENGCHKYLLLRRIESRGAFWQPVTGRLEAGEDWRD